jgi:L-aminopeptidase/D-esterase-like protein
MRRKACRTASAAEGRGFAVHGTTVPIVPAAIIFDLANGGDKGWVTSPYPALGAQAFTGRVGQASTSARPARAPVRCSPISRAVSARLRHVWNGYTVGALVAANPVGQVTVGDTPAFPRRTFRVRP